MGLKKNSSKVHFIEKVRELLEIVRSNIRASGSRYFEIPNAAERLGITTESATNDGSDINADVAYAREVELFQSI